MLLVTIAWSHTAGACMRQNLIATGVSLAHADALLLPLCPTSSLPHWGPLAAPDPPALSGILSEAGLGPFMV